MGGKTVLLLGLGRQGRAALWDLARDPRIRRILVCDPSPETAAEAAPARGREGGGPPPGSRGPPGPSGGPSRDGRRPGDPAGKVRPPGGPTGPPEPALLWSAPCTWRIRGNGTPSGVWPSDGSWRHSIRKPSGPGPSCCRSAAWTRDWDLLLCREALEGFEEVVSLRSYGAGFPEAAAADNPLKYRFTWSVPGVMRSYLRPALVIRGGEACPIPAEAVFVPEKHPPPAHPGAGIPPGVLPQRGRAGVPASVRPGGHPGLRPLRLPLARDTAPSGGSWRSAVSWTIPPSPLPPAPWCLRSSVPPSWSEGPSSGTGRTRGNLALVRVDVLGTPRRKPPCGGPCSSWIDGTCPRGSPPCSALWGSPPPSGFASCWAGPFPRGCTTRRSCPSAPSRRALRERGMIISRSETPWDGAIDRSPEGR